jgi:hypothetical protein
MARGHDFERRDYRDSRATVTPKERTAFGGLQGPGTDVDDDVVRSAACLSSRDCVAIALPPGFPAIWISTARANGGDSMILFCVEVKQNEVWEIGQDSFQQSRFAAT